MARNQLRLLMFLGTAGAAVLLVGCPRDTVDDKKSSTRVELAKDFLRRNDLEAAEAEANKGLAHNPRSSDAEYVLGMVGFFRAVGNHRLLEVDDCLTGVDAEGLRREMDSFFAAADSHFARATGFDLEHAEAWANRGTVADQLGDHAAAITYFEKALAYPNRLLNIGITRANLGWAHFNRDDHVRAAKELRQAIQFNPGMCVAKYRLGRVYFARKEWNKAAELFQTVVDDKSCPMQEAHLFLLQSNRELGSDDGAERARASCIELAPKSCMAAQCRSVPR